MTKRLTIFYQNARMIYHVEKKFLRSHPAFKVIKEG